MGLFVETDLALNQLGEDWVHWMLRELTVTRTRKSINAKWKKVGGKWQVQGYSVRKYKGKISKNGLSTRTLDYRVEEDANGNTQVYLLGEGYLINVDQGRAPFMRPGKGKGIPIKAMKRWVDGSKIRPRNPSSGAFLPNNDKNRNSMGFLMNRKIKHFGIEPTNIIEESRMKALERNQNIIADAIEADVINAINNALK